MSASAPAAPKKHKFVLTAKQLAQYKQKIDASYDALSKYYEQMKSSQEEQKYWKLTSTDAKTHIQRFDMINQPSQTPPEPVQTQTVKIGLISITVPKPKQNEVKVVHVSKTKVPIKANLNHVHQFLVDASQFAAYDNYFQDVTYVADITKYMDYEKDCQQPTEEPVLASGSPTTALAGQEAQVQQQSAGAQQAEATQLTPVSEQQPALQESAQTPQLETQASAPSTPASESATVNTVQNQQPTAGEASKTIEPPSPVLPATPVPASPSPFTTETPFPETLEFEQPQPAPNQTKEGMGCTGTWIVYMRYKRFLIVSPRDFFYVLSYKKLNNGLILIASASIEHPQFPEGSTYVRAKMGAGGTILQGVDDKNCILHNFISVDVGGWLPKQATSLTGNEEVATVTRLKAVAEPYCMKKFPEHYQQKKQELPPAAQAASVAPATSQPPPQLQPVQQTAN